MQQLFVYGSLCFEEIVEKLTGKVFETASAVLFGFKRRKVKGCDYPAIVKEPDSKVEGFIIKNVDDEAMQILTFFEGEEYRKENAEVSVGNEKMVVVIFVWQKVLDLLENEDWNFSEFKKESLKIYLDKIIPDTLEEYKKVKN